MVFRPEPEQRTDATTRPLLEYVTIANCRDCTELERLLGAVRRDYPQVELRQVSAESARGREASIERGVLRFPVVLLNDELIAIESISEADLRRHLTRAAG